MRNIHDWMHQPPAVVGPPDSRACVLRGLQPCALERHAVGIDYARAEPIVSREPPEQCPKCGGSRFEQDPDVLDTWFSSGLWPFSHAGLARADRPS